MASSKEDRVRLTYDAYSRAYQRRKGDLKAAKTETEVQKYYPMSPNLSRCISPPPKMVLTEPPPPSTSLTRRRLMRATLWRTLTTARRRWPKRSG
jgi:hypothetical protein